MRIFATLVAAVGFLIAVFGTRSSAAERVTLNFNPDWKFIKADDPQRRSRLRRSRLDHRFRAAHLQRHRYVRRLVAARSSRRAKSVGRAHVVSQDLHRRRTAWNGKKVFIEFEAVRQVAEVYLNGELLGVSKTGFTPFGFDLTPQLQIRRAQCAGGDVR